MSQYDMSGRILIVAHLVNKNYILPVFTLIKE